MVGDDTFVIVGTTAANQYSSADSVSGVIDATTINDRGVSEAVSGEVYNGGDGNYTLHVYGAVDLSSVTLTSIETIIVHSDVTFGEGQLTSMGVRVTLDKSTVPYTCKVSLPSPPL